jgi:hypothetical protein
MKTKFLWMAVAGLLIGSTAVVHAQSRGGMSGGSGPSGFAPGHERDTTGAGDRDRDERLGRGDREDRMRRGDPDRDEEISRDRDDRTTGFGGRDRDDRLRDDRDDRMMDNDSRGIDKD